MKLLLNIFFITFVGISHAQEWTEINSWNSSDLSYYVEIDDIAASPYWRFELPQNAYSLDIKAGKFNSAWVTKYRRLEISLGPNTLWYEDCPDGSTCPEWEIHNMRPDLYPSAKDAPVFTDTDKTILAKTGIYYFKFAGSGKAGLRLVFRDINGTPILSGKPLPCGGPSRTPIPSPTPPAVCDKGYLPPLNVDGYPGWFGYRKINIEPGETHTWCVRLETTTTSWTMSIVDRTGAAQCMYHTAEYIPPAGSELGTKKWSDEVINSTGRFKNWDGNPLPKGVWRIKVTASENYPSCPMAYEVTARP